MLMLDLLVFSFASCVSSQPHWDSQAYQASWWTWDIRSLQQTADHFDAYGQDTFSQRYLVNASYWAGTEQRAPIFFFTGAEGGNVLNVVGAYGHVLEMAERMGALVVFMEARFFGGSLPYGDIDSFEHSRGKIGLLSVEQMLLDYVKIISDVRDEFGAWNCPAMVFGGSLAGTLSAMMRLKYPNVVDLALVSSSPLKGYPMPGVDQFSWRKRVTDNWIKFASGQPIDDMVRGAFDALASADANTAAEVFNTCEPAYAGNVWDIQDKMWGILEGDAEFVYPPAWSRIPLRVTAATNKSGIDVFAAFYNYDGNQPCMNLTAQKLSRNLPDSKSWDYIACTEIVHPIGCNGVTDFFPPYPWSLQGTGDYCQSTWDVRPIDGGNWIPESFGFFDQDRFVASTSRILFAYGDLDPWHEFEIAAESLSPDLPVIHIPNGSHCADMSGSNWADTDDMIAARESEERIIRGWLADITAAQPELMV